MKTIGFVDYYISEWHANEYPAWIKEASQKLGEDFVVKYVWAEEYVSPVDGRNTDEWCDAFKAEKCATIAELCEKADYILVLAPSNPEKHLGYAKEVLKYKKNTYIDKTFASDYKTAKEIYKIAENYGTKFFSTSALRYAEELNGVKKANAVIVCGCGTDFDEYIIHQIEMTVKTMGIGAEAVRVEKQGAQYICRVDYGDNRGATLNFCSEIPFAITVEKADGTAFFKQIDSPYFVNLIEKILRFYQNGEIDFDANETLEVMKIREAVIKGKNSLGEWIEL